MRFTLTGTFTATYEVAPDCYTGTTPEEMLAEDIREFNRCPISFVEDDDFTLVVTGEIEEY